MASDQAFIDYVSDQLRGIDVSYRKMFGEYALYCDGKVVALICDNQVFIKPTDAARPLAGKITEAPPYPSAKPHWLIDDKLDDRIWIQALVQATANALPMPAPKKPKKKAV